MARRGDPSFDECLTMMRKRNPLTAEEGFHFLLPKAREHLPQLIAAFRVEPMHSVRCWLLELIGEARAEQAFDLLCEQSQADDQSFRDWAIRGLKLLDTPDARRFLFQNRLKG